MAKGRLVVVSNRLPVAAIKRGREWSVQPTIGGLAAALTPVLRQMGGIWIGWPGVAGATLPAEALSCVSEDMGFTLKGVNISKEVFVRFYNGFSNQVLWPLFHDLVWLMRPHADNWRGYRQANRLFAKAVMPMLKGSDFLWIHDYHLMMMAKELKGAGSESPTGFFLHIPFPSPDILVKMPWWRELLEALLFNDLIGFQSERDLGNFLGCVELLLNLKVCSSRVQGLMEIGVGGRSIHAGVFPISVDIREISQMASSGPVEEALRVLKRGLDGRALVLGVDRLDYTKGIPNRLLAFQQLLQRHEGLMERVTMIQLTAPSREEIPSYGELRESIHRLVGEINGRFATIRWTPVQYIYSALPREQLLALYRAAAVALITPLKDGMNLIAKEFCSSRVDNQGVLVLSRFAGAAERLPSGALLVNPWDIEEMADTLYTALTMPADQQRRGMEELRAVIHKEDIHWWVGTFLQAAGNIGIM